MSSPRSHQRIWEDLSRLIHPSVAKGCPPFSFYSTRLLPTSLPQLLPHQAEGWIGRRKPASRNRTHLNPRVVTLLARPNFPMSRMHTVFFLGGGLP